MTDKRSRLPAGTEPVKFNIPCPTMEALRREADRYGCSVTSIANRVLGAYASGEIRQEFTQQKV